MCDTQFPHVSHSVTPHTLVPGTLVEIELSSGLWPVCIKMVCGPLLEVLPLVPPGAKAGSSSEWYDTSKKGVWPWGEGRSSGRGIIPPTYLIEEADSSRDWYEELEPQATSLPSLQSPLVPGSGLCPTDSLRPGIKFELRSSTDPTLFWGVTVTDTVDGILGLSLDCPELKPVRDFRLFYLSSRLFPCGTVSRDREGTLKFAPPDCLRARNYPEQVWKVVSQSFSEIQPDRIAPAWCFTKDKLNPAPHNFQERMLLTVIDPNNCEQFRVAIVDRVCDQTNFVVSLLEEPTVKLLCSGDSEDIIPISWAIEHKFLEKASLQTMSCSPLSRIAGKSLFLALARSGNTFCVGDKLEFCLDIDNLEFGRARVEDVRGHILRLSVTAKMGVQKSVLASCRSQALFPEGWCQSNGIELYVETTEVAPSSGSEDARELPDVANSLFGGGGSVLSESCWCPPIYFNHLCYSASFLSRHRLESLPRYIGAGPVRLVMKEVLSRLIGSSFKSGAVLKKLEIGTRRPRPKYWVETMKGKSRVLLLQSDVEIPSLASQVAPFCREVCQKLSCCPYLFGPQLVGEECPSACNSRPKSDFHTVEGDGRPRRGVKRRRRGGKGGGVETGGQQTPGAGAQSPCQSSSGSSPSASPTPSTTVTTCTTRESSPTHNTSQQQLAVKPSSKDKETLERILAEKCREEDDLTGSREISPPPRLPSPKLLRSKSLGGGGSLSFSGGLGEPGLVPRIVELSRRGGLQPAFNVDFSTPCPDMEDPPPVRRLVLKSNPLFWNAKEVAKYIAEQEDVAQHSELFLKDEVDGQALLLLNFPSVLYHWRLRLREAILLGRHIESIKLAFYTQFAFSQRNTVEAIWNSADKRAVE